MVWKPCSLALIGGREGGLDTMQPLIGGREGGLEAMQPLAWQGEALGRWVGENKGR